MMAVISWRPGIGDPTWIGWTTTISYLLAATICARAGWRARRSAGGEGEETPAIWLMFAAGLFLLGMNKQLDLQTAFIEVGGQLALNEGWYQHRRLAQAIFVVTFGTALLGACIFIMIRYWRFFKTHKLAVLGSILLAAFIVLRAAIFNHVDDDAGLSLGEGNWLDSLEIAGVFCMFVAGFRVR